MTTGDDMTSTFDTIARAEASRPRSATPFSIGVAGMAAGLSTLWLVRDSTTIDGATRSTLACVAIIATIAFYDLFVARVYLRRGTGLANRAIRSLSLARVASRLVALASIYAIIGALYWLLPE